jgi:hypothetical protein
MGRRDDLLRNAEHIDRTEAVARSHLCPGPGVGARLEGPDGGRAGDHPPDLRRQAISTIAVIAAGTHRRESDRVRQCLGGRPGGPILVAGSSVTRIGWTAPDRTAEAYAPAAFTNLEFTESGRTKLGDERGQQLRTQTIDRGVIG